MILTRAFRSAYLSRGLVVWIGLRLALAWGSIVDPNILEETMVLAVVSAAVLADARRRNEDLFLGNLGIPAVAIGVWALPLAALAEWVLP